MEAMLYLIKEKRKETICKKKSDFGKLFANFESKDWPRARCQDRRASQARKALIKTIKKELGLEPFGNLPAYSANELLPEVARTLNSRERESLDVQSAFLTVT